MQRSASFLIHLTSCNFCTVQTPRNLDFNTFCTSTHCVLNSHLDGAAVCNLTFHLASDVITNNVSIQFWFLYFKDIYLNVLVIEFFEFLFQFVYVLTTFTNDDTRTGCTNSDGNEFECPLNDNPRNTCLGKSFVQVLADFLVFNQIIAEVFATEPI